MKTNVPIVITGCHFFGASLLGPVIAISEQTTQEQQPSEDIERASEPDFSSKLWYETVKEDSSPPSQSKQSGSGFFGLKALEIKNRLQKAKSIAEAYTELFSAIKQWKETKKGQSPVIFDPTAFFSAPWLFQRHNAEIIVMMRHPASFVSCMVQNNLRINLEQFLRSPQYFPENFGKLKSDVERAATSETSLIDNAILCWKIFAANTYVYQRDYPEWLFFRYEDFWVESTLKCRELYQMLDLPFNKSIAERILLLLNNTSTNNSDHYSRLRKGENWKSVLSLTEQDYIRERVKEYSIHFYSEESWY